MRSLLLQVSSISALLVLLSQLWRYASLERALVVTLVAGGAVYAVLLVGRTVTRYLVAASEDAPPPTPEPATPPPDPTSSTNATS
ncbi:MAG: hypothetical protein AAGI91_06430 [Bacteroidota bacterium]